MASQANQKSDQPKKPLTKNEQLIEAVQLGNQIVVEDLIKKKGADPNYVSGKHNPLRYAVLRAFFGIARFLIEQAGVDPSKDERVMHLAAMAEIKHKNMFRYLIERGCDINKVDDILGTPLMLALHDGKSNDFAKWMITEFGADPSIHSTIGEKSSALHKAAGKCAPEVVKFLLDHGAKSLVNASDAQGYTPLTAACLSRHRHKDEIVRMLIEDYGADIDHKTSYTALFLLVQHGMTETADLLLSHGANPNIKDDDMQCSPMHIAVSNNLMQIIRLLHNKGAEVNCKDKRGYTPLFMAASEGYTECCKFLVDRGAEVNYQAPDGTYAIFHAVTSGRIQTIGYLLEAGANVDFKTNDEEPISAKEIAEKEEMEPIVLMMNSEYKSMSEKLERSSDLKDEGNVFFKTKNYQSAVNSYSEALILLRVTWNLTKPQKDTLRGLKLSCFNNIAQACLLTGDNEGALTSSEQVLLTEPKNLKGLYRKSQAQFNLGNLVDAKKTIVKAIRAHPKNKLLRTMYDKIVEAKKAKEENKE